MPNPRLITEPDRHSGIHQRTDAVACPQGASYPQSGRTSTLRCPARTRASTTPNRA
jgi:hypothetical protein